MNTIFFMGIFWMLYGIAGLFGWTLINPNFKGYPWTKEYKRCRGISWLMIGIPCFILGCLILIGVNIPLAPVLLCVCGVPTIFYTHRIEKKYKAKLEE